MSLDPQVSNINEVKQVAKKPGQREQQHRPQTARRCLRQCRHPEINQSKAMGTTLRRSGKSPMGRITAVTDRSFPCRTSRSSHATGATSRPNLRSPRVFWVDVKDEEKRLRNFQKTLDYNLGQLGFERETRKFSPHLTIGRVKDRGGLGQLKEAFSRAEFPPVGIQVDDFFLIESKLNPSGPVYTELARFPL